MDLKLEKQKRIKFLFEVYKEAKKESPVSPDSVFFGLSKTRRYNMKSQQFVDSEEERYGYIIGERLGLTQDEVDAFVMYYCSREIRYMSSFIGLTEFAITQRGIMYLESLDEEPLIPVQINNNTIHVGDVSSPIQIQQNSSNSSQTQNIEISQAEFNEFANMLKKDIQHLGNEHKEEFNTEIEYAQKQLAKGKSISVQLKNIGGLIKDVGINVFANVLASPIYEMLKPFLGL
jgi:hypothetical protein